MQLKSLFLEPDLHETSLLSCPMLCCTNLDSVLSCFETVLDAGVDASFEPEFKVETLAKTSRNN